MRGVLTTCNDQIYIYMHVCTALGRNFQLESPFPVRMISRDGKGKNTESVDSRRNQKMKKRANRINYAQSLRNGSVVP